MVQAAGGKFISHTASSLEEIAGTEDRPQYSQGVYNNETIELFQYERQLLKQFLGKTAVGVEEFLDVMYPELEQKHPVLTRLTNGGQNLAKLLEFLDNQYFGKLTSLFDDIEAFQFEVQEDGLLLAVDAIYQSQEKGTCSVM